MGRLFPNFNLALIVGYPIQGHVAQGLRGLASEETTQAEVLVQGVQERIGAEARNALQSYQSALSKLNATRVARESAEAVYASEVRKFRTANRRRSSCSSVKCELEQARGSELQAQTQLDQVDRRARARRRHDSHDQRRQRRDARKSGVGAIDGIVKSRILPAAIAIAAITLAALPGPANLRAARHDAAAARDAAHGDSVAAVSSRAKRCAWVSRAAKSLQVAAQIVGVTQQPFVGISLQDAIAMALLKNPNLAVSASNFRVARYNIVAIKGNYDVQLQLKPSSSFSVQPPQNAFIAGPGEVGRYTPAPGGTPGVTVTQGPGNIIQHQSAFQYGVGGQTENGMTYRGRHPAESHLQQYRFQWVQSILSRDAQPFRNPAAAQERRHECDEAPAQARFRQRRCNAPRRR